MLLARYAAWLFSPLGICLGLLLGGLLLLWLGRRQTLGKVLVTAGTGLLLVFTSGPFGNLVIRPLEATYPAFPDPARATEAGDPVSWVVVLGAGYRPDADIPVTARPSPDGLVRLAEGVRIRRGLPGARLLILIGGAGAEDGRVEAMTDLAVALGVPPTNVVVDAGAADTLAEVEVIRRTVGTARFVLVTSAYHMPRAVRACHDQGLQPVPAPTGHQVAAAEYPVLQALPAAGNLGRAETGFHELLGGIWQAVRR